MTPSITTFIETCVTRLSSLFQQYIDSESPLLAKTMSYAISNGGKRLRPILVYATSYALDAELNNADLPACAIELIHSYSLIHDDLPAMDNAELRRGHPACHKTFGEAMAILAGDALQPLAIEILANHPANLSAQQRLNMISLLTRASGPFGMAAGQAFDINSNSSINAEELLLLYRLKTGALISASVELGTLTSLSTDVSVCTALKKYGAHIGLAFQLQDDLLDIEGSTDILGKPQGIDKTNNKITYPMLVGVEFTRNKISHLVESAITSIACLDQKADLLREIAKKILIRRK